MLRPVIAGLAVVAAVGAGVAAAAGGSRQATPLRGTVGPGFTITLTQNGKRVTRLRPGTVRIVISDRSAMHDFVLEQEKGGRFERTYTAVPFTGTRTVTVRLTKGTWKYYCAPHESGMFGRFRVA